MDIPNSSKKDMEAFAADLMKRRGIRSWSSWHGRKLSKKDRGVNIFKQKNLDQAKIGS